MYSIVLNKPAEAVYNSNAQHFIAETWTNCRLNNDLSSSLNLSDKPLHSSWKVQTGTTVHYCEMEKMSAQLANLQTFYWNMTILQPWSMINQMSCSSKELSCNLVRTGMCCACTRTMMSEWFSKQVEEGCVHVCWYSNSSCWQKE